jgi:hypothetical protein
MVQIFLQTVCEVNLQDNQPEMGTLNGPLDRVCPLNSSYDLSLSKTLTQLRPLFFGAIKRHVTALLDQVTAIVSQQASNTHTVVVTDKLYCSVMITIAPILSRIRSATTTASDWAILGSAR